MSPPHLNPPVSIRWWRVRRSSAILELRPMSSLVSFRPRWQLEPTVWPPPLTKLDKTYSERAHTASHNRSQEMYRSNSTDLRMCLSSLNSVIPFAVFWFSFSRFFWLFLSSRFSLRRFLAISAFFIWFFPPGRSFLRFLFFCWRFWFFRRFFGVFKAKCIPVLNWKPRIRPTRNISPGPSDKNNSFPETLPH